MNFVQLAGLTPVTDRSSGSERSQIPGKQGKTDKKKAGNQLLISSFPAQIALIS